MRYLGPAAEVKTVKRVLKNPVGIGDTFMLVRALRCAIRSMTGYGTRLRGVPFRWRQKRASQLSCATVPYPYGLLTIDVSACQTNRMASEPRCQNLHSSRLAAREILLRVEAGLV
jgi:hypothetical protein